MTVSKSKPVWTLADAQANLPEVLRLAESEGPQYIKAAATFVVTPAEPDPPQNPDPPQKEERMPLGRWLIENVPRGTNLVIPDDRSSSREIPFSDESPGGESEE